MICHSMRPTVRSKSLVSMASGAVRCGTAGSGTVTFPLISYTGTDPFSTLASVVLPPGGFSGHLSDNSANGRIDLVITAGPNTIAPFVGSLTWNGGGADNNWSTTANWNGTNLKVICQFLFFFNIHFTKYYLRIFI